MSNLSLSLKKILRHFKADSRLVFLLSVAVLVAAAIFLAALILVRVKQVIRFDDSYMFIRYAQNFWDGYGAAWNRDGVKTYGTTSILYLAIIILLQGIFRSAEGHVILTLASAVLGIAGALVTVFISARLAKSKNIRSSFLLVLAAVSVSLILSKNFLFHLTSGMDTTLSFLCNAFLIWAGLDWAYRKDKKIWLVILAAYLSFLARPDNIIYAVSFPVLCAFLFDETARWKRIFYFIGIFGIVLVADGLLKTRLLGDPLPLPFYAKTSGYYEGYLSPEKWSPVIHLFEFGKLALPFSVTVILTFSNQRSGIKLLAVFFLPVLVTFSYYFTVLQIMGHEARYYFPSLPFFIIGSILIADDFFTAQSVSPARRRNFNARVILAGVVAFLVLIPQIQIIAAAGYEQWFIPKPRVFSASIKYTTDSNQPLPEFGWWESITVVSDMAKNLPDGTKFALSEYGYVGSRALQLHIIDPLGLHDPIFAHNGFSAAEFFSRQPDLIWFPHSDYSKIIAAIQDAPEFWSDYDYYPAAFDYGFAVRKGSADLISVEVQRAWRRAYGNLNMDAYLARRVK